MNNSLNNSNLPPDMPESTPSRAQSGGQLNWIVQQQSQLTCDIKVLMNTVEMLGRKIDEKSADNLKQLDKLGADVESMKQKITNIEKKIYAATLIVGIAIAVGAFVANKAIDFGLKMAEKGAFETNQNGERKNQ